MFALPAKDFFPSESPITVEPRQPQDAFPEHTHLDFHEIVIVREGTGSHVLNDEQKTLSPGCALFIRSSDHHLFEHVNNLHLTNVLYKTHFPSPDLNRFINENNYLQIGLTSMKRAESIINQLSMECPFNDQYSQQMSEALLTQLAVTLIRGNIDMNKCSGDKEERFFGILKFLQENYTQTIDMEEVASDFQLPVRTLHRMMKSYTGLTPGQYLNNIRINSATHMLRRTDIPITQIAYQCGFNDSNYFASRFRQRMGCTPSGFRTKSFNF